MPHAIHPDCTVSRDYTRMIAGTIDVLAGTRDPSLFTNADHYLPATQELADMRRALRHRSATLSKKEALCYRLPRIIRDAPPWRFSAYESELLETRVRALSSAYQGVPSGLVAHNPLYVFKCKLLKNNVEEVDDGILVLPGGLLFVDSEVVGVEVFEDYLSKKVENIDPEKPGKKNPSLIQVA